MKSVRLMCDPFMICVSFHELTNNKNIKMGRKVLVLIIVYLLLICATRNALSKAKATLPIFESREFGVR